MKIGKFEILWSDVGKIVAGIVTVFVSFFIFLYVSGWLRILFLAALVIVFFAYKTILARSRMSPDLKSKLKGDKERKQYGS
jgi:hypothetical protein